MTTCDHAAEAAARIDADVCLFCDQDTGRDASLAYMASVIRLSIAAATAELRERCERAEAVVAKLPKTADGVPIPPGVHVYWKYNPQLEFIPLGRLSAVPAVGGASEPMSEMYSTREAAQAAKERR